MALNSRKVVLAPGVRTRLDIEVESDRSEGYSLVVSNRSAVDCELGSSSLDIGEGFTLGSMESIPLTLDRDNKGLYGISAEQITLEIIEVGV